MTQNLRIAGTISSEDSNFSTNSTWNVQVSDLTAGNSYTEARSHFPTATDSNGYTVKQLGAWYNYCAASAGTVCSQTQANATQDICPSGWHLPSYNTASGSISGSTSYSSAFSPIYGGRYYYGSLRYATTQGAWWSSTAYNTDYQYSLDYDNGSLDVAAGNSKSYGYYVRCVRSS